MSLVNDMLQGLEQRQQVPVLPMPHVLAYTRMQLPAKPGQRLPWLLLTLVLIFIAVYLLQTFDKPMVKPLSTVEVTPEPVDSAVIPVIHVIRDISYRETPDQISLALHFESAVSEYQIVEQDNVYQLHFDQPVLPVHLKLPVIPSSSFVQQLYHASNVLSIVTQKAAAWQLQTDQNRLMLNIVKPDKIIAASAGTRSAPALSSQPDRVPVDVGRKTPIQASQPVKTQPVDVNPVKIKQVSQYVSMAETEAMLAQAMQQQQWSNAAAYLDKLIQHDGNNLSYHQQQLQVLSQLDPSQALTQSIALIQRYPEQVGFYQTALQLAVGQQQHHQANQIIRQIEARTLTALMQTDQYHWLVAVNAEAQQDTQAAYQALTQALVINPQHAQVWLLLALNLETQGRLTEARQAYETLLQLPVSESLVRQIKLKLALLNTE